MQLHSVEWRRRKYSEKSDNQDHVNLTARTCRRRWNRNAYCWRGAVVNFQARDKPATKFQAKHDQHHQADQRRDYICKKHWGESFTYPCANSEVRPAHRGVKGRSSQCIQTWWNRLLWRRLLNCESHWSPICYLLANEQYRPSPSRSRP